LDLNENAYGIYIPADEILSRKNYEWFARLSCKQVLECNSIICKYILLACFPNGYSIESISMQNREKEKQKNQPHWIQFWSTPLLQYSDTNNGYNSGLYMVKQPNMLGDNLRAINNDHFLQDVSTY
jgi:hypothetical protein